MNPRYRERQELCFLFAGLVPPESQQARVLDSYCNEARQRGADARLLVHPLSFKHGAHWAWRLICSRSSIAYVRFNWAIGPILIVFGFVQRIRRAKFVLHVPTPIDAVIRESADSRRWKLWLKKMLAVKSYQMAGLFANVIVENGFSTSGNLSSSVKTLYLPNAAPRIAASQPKRKRETLRGTIVVIGVTSTGHYHSYHRAISGLAEWDKTYQGNEHVRLVLIGPIARALRLEHQLAQQVDWKKAEVVFPGKLSARDVDDLIQGAHFGLGPLGYDKIGLTHGSPLRHKTFLAAALPFATSLSELAAEGEHFASIFKVEPGKAPVNFTKMLEWAGNIAPDVALSESRHLLARCEPKVLFSRMFDGMFVESRLGTR